MPYKAVIFDLYGTLVGNFSRRAYDTVLQQMAEVLGVPFPQFSDGLKETFNARCLGGYRTFEDNLADVCRRLTAPVDTAQIEKAGALNYEFIRRSIVPDTGVPETLRLLKSEGLEIGLISNCNGEVPRLFPESALAEHIKVAVFSCEERLKKPDRRIYEITCERLNVLPQECIYVGDGSGEELSAAKGLSMLPILKRTDLTDVYDPHRPEVEHWRGLAIDEIAELRERLHEFTRR